MPSSQRLNVSDLFHCSSVAVIAKIPKKILQKLEVWFNFFMSKKNSAQPSDNLKLDVLVSENSDLVQKPVLEDFEKESQERENRRRELEEELRKLDLEEKEQLAMISNFKSPEPELQPISPPPSIHDDLINDMDDGMFG